MRSYTDFLTLPPLEREYSYVSPDTDLHIRWPSMLLIGGGLLGPHFR